MIGVLIFGLLSVFLGFLIMLLNKFLNNEDDKVKEIEKLLPGFNCGGCGFPNCNAMAKNLLEKKVDPEKCRPIKSEALEILKKHLEN